MKTKLFENSYDYGIVSFSEYKKHRRVKDKDWIKTIIVFIFPYPGGTVQKDAYLSAKYAYGKDYHLVIKSKLEEIAKELKLEKYEVMTDISFLDEKLSASLAGLGSLGKNNLLINPKYGSRILIGEIITSEEFPEMKKTSPQLCLDCDICVRRCPTAALDNGFKKERCLSYLSQTKGKNYPLYDKMNLFVGCDICQDVCPLNNKEYSYLPEFDFDSKSEITLKDLEKLNEESFKDYYQDKAFAYLGYLKILRNILILEVNSGKIGFDDLDSFREMTDEIWFLEHLEYLKRKLKNG